MFTGCRRPCAQDKTIMMKKLISYRSNIMEEFRFKVRFSTYCYSMFYRGILISFVVPMLYPYKRKSPYTIHIQAYKNLSGDPERTEVEPIHH